MSWTSEEAGIFAYVQGELSKHMTASYALKKGYEVRAFELPDLMRSMMGMQYGKNDLGNYGRQSGMYGGLLSYTPPPPLQSPTYGTPDVRYH
ncbi:MAG TPA: hypothetical protein VJB66_02350 [Candidatus Nanoarchaeia archaeon]|nr:hypothetical protein [Candidatus Nanoarchaeia archaeon]